MRSQAADKQSLALVGGVLLDFWLRGASSMPVLSYTATTLEAEVGIGRLKCRFRAKNAIFCG